MALSIPRQLDAIPGPAGERRLDCDYCGIKWYRSVCRRDAAGLISCPDCQADGGRDTVTCDRANAANSASARVRRPAPEKW